MDTSRISLDIDSLDGALDIADTLGGTLGITSEGRLLVYGVPNAKQQVERINGPDADDPGRPAEGWWALITDEGDGYVGFDL